MSKRLSKSKAALLKYEGIEVRFIVSCEEEICLKRMVRCRSIEPYLQHSTLGGSLSIVTKTNTKLSPHFCGS